MSTPPTQAPLGHLSDQDLAALASTWRARAGRGEREAFGIAHALEVELRRRTRDSQMQPLPSATNPASRPWWRFWKRRRVADAEGGPLSPT